MLVAAEALAALGLTRVSFDLTLPMLVPSLLDDAGFKPRPGGAVARARPQGRRRGRAPWRPPRSGLTDLLLAAGPADRALAALAEAKLPGLRGALAERVAQTVAAIRAAAPELRLTVDPVEFRGFRYETGVSVTVYAPGRHEELGRGGRYISGESEPATGLTLYPDSILRVAPPRQARPRVFLPFGTDRGLAASLRTDGFATVAALASLQDDTAEATRLGCSHILRSGKAALLHTES